MRLARFAQAMSRTKLAIHISRCRSSLYCSCMRWTPPPPGARRRYCLGMRGARGRRDWPTGSPGIAGARPASAPGWPRALRPGAMRPMRLSHSRSAALQKVSVDRRDRGHQMDGKPEGGRRWTQALAVEAGRRDAHDGHRLPVDGEAGADDRGIASEFLLPRLEAEDSNRRGALHIVGGAQQASGVRAKTEGIEGISGDEFAVPRLRGMIAAAAAHRHLVIRRFKGGEAGKARSVVAELFVLPVREQRPVVHRFLRSREDRRSGSTVRCRRRAIGSRILNRQRSEQHRMHQGKNRRSGADAKRQGQNGSERESRRSAATAAMHFSGQPTTVLPPDAGAFPPQDPSLRWMHPGCQSGQG